MLFRSEELHTIALNHISSNVMIADNKFNIVYINSALRNFFTEKNDDIKEHYPSLSLDNLVGQNIDIFELNVKLSEQLSEKNKATLKIGHLTFNLVASDAKNSKDKKLGTVIEWQDSASSSGINDLQAQVDAISKSQAVIRFDPQGNILDCNENFTATVKYQKSEIIGKHHRIFVDKQYAESKEYKDFWLKLGAGEFDGGEYKRFDKDGNVLWLQATYNPLFDDQGKIKGVIKFASDITEQTSKREKSREAQRSISTDLQGIIQSVSVANERAQNSSTASQEASMNVQSVSAGIEELAASVQEINRQVTDASRISGEAVTQAQTTNEIVSKMSDAAQEIANVVNLISDIAEQTNLLALNATIEAARAGEAGRGFSVVASEVKELASQTSKATEEIGSRIVNVQNTSVEAVDALKEISEVINNISEISTSISGAVEEQSVTMNEMSSNMSVASNGVQTMDKAIGDIANSITTIDETTRKVQKVSESLS